MWLHSVVLGGFLDLETVFPPARFCCLSVQETLIRPSGFHQDMIGALYFLHAYFCCDVRLHRLHCYRKRGVSMETEVVK